jgi:hypothetical protein
LFCGFGWLGVVFVEFVGVVFCVGGVVFRVGLVLVVLCGDLVGVVVFSGLVVGYGGEVGGGGGLGWCLYGFVVWFLWVFCVVLGGCVWGVC